MKLFKIWFTLALSLMIYQSQVTDGTLLKEWCIASEQRPDTELQVALDWACGIGGANCSKIQVGQSCFQPNTVKAHASYAFNNYYQKFKHKGASCYFKGAAITTDIDPSHNSCNYESVP